MRARMPSFDFSAVTGRWVTRAPEFGQVLNSNSIVIPHLERFLNRVMARARAAIPDDGGRNRQVREDISVFIKQESCHYTIHGAFNDRLLADGYDRLPEFERMVVAHYDRLLATKSLPFLVAYCEGFESMLPPIASGWFDGSMDALFEDAEPNAVAMWRWHMMEEFEHRTVCHDALTALGCGYLRRLWGYLYQVVAYQRMSFKIFFYLLSVDQARMSAKEAAESKANARRSVMGFFKPVIGGMLTVLRPSYSPRKVPVPPQWASARDEIEATWVKSATALPA